MSRIQTRALVEGAIFAAVTVIIGIIKFYIPVVAVISIVWSVPTILIAFRHGFKVSIYSIVVSSVLVAIMTQPIEGLGFFIGFGIPGIVMGYLLKKKLSPGKTIFITGLVLTICSLASLYLGFLAMGIDMIKAYDKMFIDMKNTYKDTVNSLSSTYGAMGISREDMLKGAEAFEKNLELIKLILPGGFLVSGILLSFSNFKLTRLVLRKINYSIEDVIPFAQWRLSSGWMILVMTVLIGVLAEMSLLKLPQLNVLTMNLLTVIMILVAVLGLSVAKFFMDKYSVPKALKVILLFLLLFSSFSNITMLIGVFDMFLDIRRLQKA